MKKVLFCNQFAIVVLVFTIFLPISISHASIVGSSNPKATLTSGLVGYWTLDGEDTNWNTNVVRDMSGNNNNGQMLNMSTTTSAVRGRVGQAISLNGTSYITNTNPSIDGTGVKSISYWFNTSTPTSVCSHVSLSRNTSDTDMAIIFTENSRIVIDTGNGGRASSAATFTGNDWHHVYVAKNGSGVTSVYLDGQSSLGGYVDQTSGDLQVSIGTDLNNGNPLYRCSEKLDDVRIYNRALSASEIRQLYAMGASTKVAVSPKYSLNSGLVGYWTFDGEDINWNTNVVRDKSGSNNNGQMLNMSTTTSAVRGRVGQALKFDGVNRTTKVSGNPLGSGGPLTISAWIYPQNIESTIVGSGLHTATIFYVYSSNSRMAFSNDDGATVALSAENSITQNTWQHVLITENASNQVTFYINGVMSGTADQAAGTQTNGSTENWIGSTRNNDKFYKGSIDDVRVYNRALSANEVRQLYAMGASTKVAVSPKYSLNSGLVGYWTFDGEDTNWNTNIVTDKSGNNNNGQMLNMSTTTSAVRGKVGQGLNFDGVDDYVNIGTDTSLNITGAFSISTWIKPSVDVANQVIFTKGVFAGGANSVQFDLARGRYSADGSISVEISNGTTKEASGTAANKALINTWTYVTATFDGSYICVYINGVQEPCSAQLSNMLPLNTSGYTPSIGADTHLGVQFPYAGLIDDLRLYSRALSASEVRQLYNIGR